MKMDWFRSWHGAPLDHKWLSVARRAKVPTGVVVSIVWALYDHASKSEPRGDVSRFDTEGHADFLGWELSQVLAVISAMTDKEMIVSGRIANWERYQPKTEDGGATERKRQQRQRDKETVTLCDKADVTECHAASPEVTTDKRRVEKIRGEREERKKRDSSVADATDRIFDEWYGGYPRHVGRGQALKAFRLALKKVDVAILMAGAKRARKQYATTEQNFIPLASTWLNGERWLDENVTAKTEAYSTKNDPAYRGVI